MTVQFDHPASDHNATAQYRFEWALASNQAVIVKSNTVAKNNVGIVTESPLRLWCGVERPSPLGSDPYVLRVVAINAAGEAASGFSAPFVAAPPAAPSNVTVHDPHL